MNVVDQQFYVLGQTEFDQLLLNRLRQLEEGLANLLIECTEMQAVVNITASRSQYETVHEAANARKNELSNNIDEIRVRIDALRALSDEFSEPKRG